jgi:hypothetical protein
VDQSRTARLIMPTQDTSIPESILEIQAQLEQFRSAHAPRTRLPVTLWQSAAEQARQHGIYIVAHSLRLDYTTLKKHVNGSAATHRQRRKNAAAAKFVELIGTAARVDEYVIEFESDQGPKLRVHCKTATPPDWAALLEAWRRGE